MNALLTMVMLASCAHRGIPFPGPLSALHYPEATPAIVADELEPTPEPGLEPGPEPELAPEPEPHHRNPDRGEARVAKAVVNGSRALLGRRQLSFGSQVYVPDCLGLVEAAYAPVDFSFIRDMRGVYDQAWELEVFHKDPLPHPGDVAFFDNSFDKNRNGRRDDPLTHVGVVESVDEDGTIVMIHLGSRGKPVTRKRMNLLRPHTTRDEAGKIINEHLRATSARDGGPTLAAELWSGFASFWAVSPEEISSR